MMLVWRGSIPSGLTLNLSVASQELTHLMSRCQLLLKSLSCYWTPPTLWTSPKARSNHLPPLTNLGARRKVTSQESSLMPILNSWARTSETSTPSKVTSAASGIARRKNHHLRKISPKMTSKIQVTTSQSSQKRRKRCLWRWTKCS